MVRALIGLVALGAAAAGVAAASGDSDDPSGAGRCGDWSESAQGRPSTRRIAAPSYLVWHDPRGWHLRARTPAAHSGARFRGRVVTAGAILRARPRADEGRDTVSRTRHSIVFDFRTRGSDADGFDFAVRCGAVAFRLRPLSRTVLLGSGARAPGPRFTLRAVAESGAQGTVVTRPTCPVEGADDDCAPRPTQTTVDAFEPAERGEPAPTTPQASVPSDAGGRFRMPLPPGRYDLVPRPLNPGQTGIPTAVTVTEGVMTDVELTVDSGIR